MQELVRRRARASSNEPAASRAWTRQFGAAAARRPPGRAGDISIERSKLSSLAAYDLWLITVDW